jgi:PAS domain S-box-containing protein
MCRWRCHDASLYKIGWFCWFNLVSYCQHLEVGRLPGRSTVTYRLDKALKERLPAQVEDLDRIWNVLQDLLVITDANGQYISVNPAWTTALGWSEAELLGHMPEWLIHPDDLGKTWINQFAAGQRTLRFKNRLRHKNGTYGSFSWVAVRDRERISDSSICSATCLSLEPL